MNGPQAKWILGGVWEEIVRGIHYFFHQLALSNVDSSPINIILGNGTVVDLNIDRPFEKENGIQKISLAPFYQRFSKLYHTK